MIMMTEKDRSDIAIFRFGLIAPLYNDTISSKEYFQQIEGKVHVFPYYGERKIAEKTIKEWLLKYRRYGLDGLKPKVRADRGTSRKVSFPDEDQIIELRKKLIHMPVKVFYDYLVKKGEIIPNQISYSSVNRLLKKNNLAGKIFSAMPERKRFSHEKVNVLWQGDLSHGPTIRINGKAVKTYLILYIDDCSRIVPYGQFFSNEKFDGLRIVTKEALVRRGKPTMIYVDNGKIYCSDILKYACAKLGISLIHTKPYDAASKGKVERLFKTIRTRFYPTLEAEPVNSLEELNKRFMEWLEQDYHRKPHASLEEKAPWDIFISQSEQLKLIEDVALLDVIFLRREKRKVRKDGTIVLDKKLYEVPAQYIGQTIDVRFDEDEIFIFEDDSKVAKATRVNMVDNAHTKRSKSPYNI
jgi:putative transposase